MKTTLGWEDPTINKQYVGVVMTNFDHSVDEKVARALLEPGTIAAYTAWDFYGHVWHEGGMFYCLVKRYRIPVSAHKCETLKEMMEEVSGEWGWD